MTTRSKLHEETRATLRGSDWLKIGISTALFSIAAVLLVQRVALSIWPDLVAFKPLDSYPRSALFTLVPAIGATFVFAWMTRHMAQPGRKFLILSSVLLLLSFIPDYLLPLAGKSLLGSSVAAFMHLTAGIVTVGTLLTGFRRKAAARQLTVSAPPNAT